MWERDLSVIWFTGERERNISGAFGLAVSDWVERTHTKRNIELSITLLRFAHMLCLWAELCFVYSVTGETLLSTTTTAPPAGRELICIYAATNSASLWDYGINNFNCIKVSVQFML